MKSRILMLLAICGTLYISSCGKKDDTNNQNINYSKLAEDSQIAQSMSDDASSQVNNESKGGQYSSNIEKNNGGIASWTSQMDSCAIITLDPNGGVFPMTLTIDFGSTGCTGLDYKTRKGKLTAVFSGRYTDAGSVVTISFDNYYVNGYKVEGTKTITTNGRVGGNLSFTERDIDGRITKPDGGIITWESTRTNSWVEGELSTGWLGIFDDKYAITGSATGQTSDGTDYEIDITTPLQYEVLCNTTYNVVTEGALSYKVEGTEVATLDYGSGTCDRNVVVSYGGNDYTIVIQ
jgi:hypothetical protein